MYTYMFFCQNTKMNNSYYFSFNFIFGVTLTLLYFLVWGVFTFFLFYYMNIKLNMVAMMIPLIQDVKPWMFIYLLYMNVFYLLVPTMESIYLIFKKKIYEPKKLYIMFLYFFMEVYCNYVLHIMCSMVGFLFLAYLHYLMLNGVLEFYNSINVNSPLTLESWRNLFSFENIFTVEWKWKHFTKFPYMFFSLPEHYYKMAFTMHIINNLIYMSLFMSWLLFKMLILSPKNKFLASIMNNKKLYLCLFLKTYNNPNKFFFNKITKFITHTFLMINLLIFEYILFNYAFYNSNFFFIIMILILGFFGLIFLLNFQNMVAYIFNFFKISLMYKLLLFILFILFLLFFFYFVLKKVPTVYEKFVLFFKQEKILLWKTNLIQKINLNYNLNYFEKKKKVKNLTKKLFKWFSIF